MKWLAGVELPVCVQRTFSREPGGSRNKARKIGARVRFIEATMLELGKPDDPASIYFAGNDPASRSPSKPQPCSANQLADPELEEDWSINFLLIFRRPRKVHQIIRRRGHMRKVAGPSRHSMANYHELSSCLHNR